MKQQQVLLLILVLSSNQKNAAGLTYEITNYTVALIALNPKYRILNQTIVCIVDKIKEADFYDLRKESNSQGFSYLASNKNFNFLEDKMREKQEDSSINFEGTLILNLFSQQFISFINVNIQSSIISEIDEDQIRSHLWKQSLIPTGLLRLFITLICFEYLNNQWFDFLNILIELVTDRGLLTLKVKSVPMIQSAMFWNCRTESEIKYSNGKINFISQVVALIMLQILFLDIFSCYMFYIGVIFLMKGGQSKIIEYISVLYMNKRMMAFFNNLIIDGRVKKAREIVMHHMVMTDDIYTLRIRLAGFIRLSLIILLFLWQSCQPFMNFDDKLINKPCSEYEQNKVKLSEDCTLNKFLDLNRVFLSFIDSNNIGQFIENPQFNTNNIIRLYRKYLNNIDKFNIEKLKNKIENKIEKINENKDKIVDTYNNLNRYRYVDEIFKNKIHKYKQNQDKVLSDLKDIDQLLHH